MKKKWKQIKKVFRVDPYAYSTMDMGTKKLMTVVVIVVALLCFGTSVMDFHSKSLWSVLVTIGMALVFIACGCLALWRPKKRQMTKYCAMFALASVFTIYAIKGYNTGFAPIWAMAIPYATMSVIGLWEGFLVSGYILVVYCVMFWTPVNACLEYSYPVDHLIRIPLLYMLCFVVSLYSNYKRQEAMLRAKWEQDRLSVAVEEERRKIGKITMQTIISISNAVDAKDPYTKKHSERVAKYSKIIANELHWSKKEQEKLYNMALMHDIGKIGVPDAILNKHGRLTDEEFPEMKKHPIIGGQILKDLTIVDDVSTGAFFHHERYDGKGYPHGLKGEEIPIEARIIGIADSIDAMNSDRVYRGKQSTEYVLEQLEAGKGTQFDPNIDEIVIALIKSGKMRLNTG